MTAEPVHSDRAPGEQPAATWYSAGLQFRCTQCGNCCTGAPGAVWVDDQEIQAIADYLARPVGEIRLLQTRPLQGKVSLTEHSNGDCTFFDPQGRGCTIYPVRPKQCQTWPFWNSNLSSKEAWKSTRRDCPGAGHGDFVSFEDIEICRATIDI